MDRKQKSRYEAAAEAILFALGDPIEDTDLARALGVTVQETEEIVSGLQKRYQDENSGLQILQLEHSYQMCTRPEFYPWLIRAAGKQKKQVLSNAMLETLSIVAYRQPVTRMEIEKIRGVSCAHVMNRLLDYDLIQEVGRLDAPGRPILFGTTEEFLRHFGLKSIEDLPMVSSDKRTEIKKEAEKEAAHRIV